MNKTKRKRFPITLILLLCGINFLVGQSLLENEIQFEIQNSSIPDAIFLLSEKTGLSISFDSSIFPKNKKISINKTATIRDILSDCLKGYNVQYQVDGTSVLLLAKPLRKLTLSGYLEDKATGERLIGATIFDQKTGKGTYTNEYGFFSITLVEGDYEIGFSYLGYQLEKKKIRLDKNQSLNVRMKSSLILAEVLVVAPTKDSSEITENKLTKQTKTINPSPHTAASSLGGELDILQHCYSLAGVETGADGFGGMHVRGGEVGQNLTLMDGVPVYNPSHTLGLISIFNANTVKHASFHKGGFSSKYGGRISSVLDVRTREGNNQKFAGEIKLGTFAGSLLLEGPIIKDKVSFFLSTRRSYIKPLVALYSALSKADNSEDEVDIDYGFYDLNGKINWVISKKDRIYLSYYSGSDNYLDENNSEENTFIEDDDSILVTDNYLQHIAWGNLISSLRWNHQFGSKLFSNLTATYSQYHYDSFSGSEYAEFNLIAETGTIEDSYLEFKSNIIERALRLDFDYLHSPMHTLKFGGSYRNRSFDSGIVSVEDFDEEIELDSAEAFLEDLFEEQYFNAHEYAVYLQDDIRLQDLTVNAGLRATGFTTSGKNYYSFEPRLAMDYGIRPNFKLGISATSMTQYVHLLTSFGAGMPNDIWIPSTRYIKPQRSWQFTLGGDWKIKEGLTMHSELYYKRMHHLLSYQDSIGLSQLTEVNAEDWQQEIAAGMGESYGWETSLKRKTPKYAAGINYTLAKSTRKYEDLNEGKTFPFSFDRPHSLKLFFDYKLTKKITFSLNWAYSTGRPITLIKSAYGNFLFGEGFNRVEEVLSSKNGYRLSANHRLNLGFDFHFPTKWGGHHLSLGIYNAYNRKNVLYEYRESEFEDREPSLQKVALLPILPTIGYRVFFK